ncbi:MAG: cache domain-containing protein [Candidatus Omnitrophica bacterium]|nr:cache domain-containing protein [Candidatus Omnitrophota bacterium]MDD5436255.1 cache domain-containing protein [Candidatus Omnitrophota bacterium]
MKWIKFAIGIAVVISLFGIVGPCAAQDSPDYKYKETKDLMSLVRDAAGIVQTNGETAFQDLKKEGSPWRQKESFIFVLDTAGNMVVHPDPAYEGKNEMETKDVNGKPVTKGIIDSTASAANRNEGWFHYTWPSPGTIFASWKSAFAKRVVAPSGKVYVVAAGLYNPKVEDRFLTDAVDAAVGLIEKEGPAAFGKLRDKSGQFVFLGTYIFVDTPEGVEVVNGGFPDVEGQNIFDYKDANGKFLTREVIDTALNKGSGWVDYLWPKPGETKSSKKHTYVKRAVYGDKKFAVAAGAYIKDGSAPAPQDNLGNIIGSVMILDLKGGDKVAGKITREAGDYIFLENMDGSMEVSFPRNKILKVRKPTDAELAKLTKSVK